jgi:hypothetical protein
MSVMIGGEQPSYNFNRANFLSRTDRGLSDHERFKPPVVRRTVVAEIVMPGGGRQLISGAGQLPFYGFKIGAIG